jgi:hypothetical protein
MKGRIITPVYSRPAEIDEKPDVRVKKSAQNLKGPLWKTDPHRKAIIAGHEKNRLNMKFI